MLEKIHTGFDIGFAVFFLFSWILMRFFSPRMPPQKRLEKLLLFWFLGFSYIVIKIHLIKLETPYEILSFESVSRGAIAYIFTIFVLSPIYLSKRLILLLISAIIVFMACNYALGYSEVRCYTYADFYANLLTPAILLRLGLLFLFFSSVVFWQIISFKTIPIFQKRIENEFSDENYSILWMKQSTLFLFILTCAYIVRIFWNSPIAAILYDIVFTIMFINAVSAFFMHKFARVDYRIRLQARSDEKEKMDIVSIQPIQPIQQEVKTWLETKKPFLNSDFEAQMILDNFPQITRGELVIILQNLYAYTFLGAVQRLRIKEAKRLMKEEPNLSLKQIAFQIGFTTYSSFSRSFKAIEGRPPKEMAEE